MSDVGDHVAPGEPGLPETPTEPAEGGSVASLEAERPSVEAVPREAPVPVAAPVEAPPAESPTAESLIAEAPPVEAPPAAVRSVAIPAPGAATVPKAAGGPEPEAGRIVGGLVQQINADEIDLTLDDGRPAVIHRRNFDAAGTDPTEAVTPGDRLEGAILSREDPKSRVVLSRAWAQKKQAWSGLETVASDKVVVTGTVTAVAKRGVVVEVHGLRGFVPSSHLELDPPTDVSSYVGQTLDLRVLDIDPAKERLVLSRRAILMKERRRATHGVLTSLVVGEERTGRVSSLADYGAFVDLDGVTGLVHVSELAWGRVHRPGDIVSVGDEVKVKVLDVKVKRKRVSLSIRQLVPDPIAELVDGEVVSGPVTRLADFGAFVDVGGVEGLVHLSELAEHRIFTPEEVVSPGEQVRVKILSVDRKRRRIELSIRRAVSG